MMITIRMTYQRMEWIVVSEDGLRPRRLRIPQSIVGFRDSVIVSTPPLEY